MATHSSTEKGGRKIFHLASVLPVVKACHSRAPRNYFLCYCPKAQTFITGFSYGCSKRQRHLKRCCDPLYISMKKYYLFFKRKLDIHLISNHLRQ